jgi:hypothetical protein
MFGRSPIFVMGLLHHRQFRAGCKNKCGPGTGNPAKSVKKTLQYPEIGLK